MARPKRGPVPPNNPPDGIPDTAAVVNADDGEAFAMVVQGPRVAFLKFFEGGGLPVVGRNYALACVEYDNGGPDDDEIHFAAFRLVRVYA